MTITNLTGRKMIGTEQDATTAGIKSPSLNSCIFPFSMSVATTRRDVLSCEKLRAFRFSLEKNQTV